MVLSGQEGQAAVGQHGSRVRAALASVQRRRREHVEGAPHAFRPDDSNAVSGASGGPTLTRHCSNAEEVVPGMTNSAAGDGQAAGADSDEHFEAEVAEVMAQLLASARESRAAVEAVADFGGTQPDASRLAENSRCRPLRDEPRSSRDGNQVGASKHGACLVTPKSRPASSSAQSVAPNVGASPPNIAAVAGLQARVEQRAVKLQRDLDILAEQKRSLLQQEVEQELAREAQHYLQEHESLLRQRTEQAVQEIRTAFETARADFEATIAEIDGHLATLGQVRASVEARQEEHKLLRQQYRDALVSWVADAKVAQGDRLSRHAAANSRWVRENVSSIVPDVLY